MPHRRPALLLVLVLALLAACGSEADEPQDAAVPEDTVRTVETEFGPVDVPSEPERVVALDEYAALTAMAIGVEPVVTFASFQSVVGGQIIEEAGLPLEPATAETGPNFEAIAEADPDLIIYSTEGAVAPSHDQLSEMAPAVALPYNEPWRDVIRTTATVFGADDEGDRLIGLLEGRVEELQSALADEPMSISVLGDSLGMTFAASMDSPMSGVIDEAGFERPPAQADGTPDQTYTAAIPTSLENLGEHDADVVAVLSGAYYNAETLLDAPTFQNLPAVQDGRSVVIDGDMWFGTYPFAIFWLLEDLGAVHAGEGQGAMGTADDLDARWAAYEELVA